MKKAKFGKYTVSKYNEEGQLVVHGKYSDTDGRACERSVMAADYVGGIVFDSDTGKTLYVAIMDDGEADPINLVNSLDISELSSQVRFDALARAARVRLRSQLENPTFKHDTEFLENAYSELGVIIAKLNHLNI